MQSTSKIIIPARTNIVKLTCGLIVDSRSYIRLTGKFYIIKALKNELRSLPLKFQKQERPPSNITKLLADHPSTL
jgi:hypothetical protein